MNMTYFCYALLSGLVPAMSNQFLSYTRFLVLCFPVFIAMAEKLRGHDLVFWYVLGVFGVMQVIFLIRHINGFWAG